MLSGPESCWDVEVPKPGSWWGWFLYSASSGGFNTCSIWGHVGAELLSEGQREPRAGTRVKYKLQAQLLNIYHNY